MNFFVRLAAGACVLSTLYGLAACGGSGSKGSHSIGGTVSGLSGSGLVLTDNGGDSLTVAGNGSFTFATPVTDGNAFNVQVATQSSQPSQTCSVAHGSGTVSGTDVTNVAVTCTTNTYTIGGTVTGLSGSGLALANNGANNFTVSGNGAFTFTTSVASGGTYAVTVAAQPTNPPQTCALANASGTVASTNITNVAVNCTTNTYSVVAYVSGLTGTGLTLTYNGGTPVAINRNGPTVMASSLAIGTLYAVAIAGQPANPAQTCVLSNGSGTIATANVTSISVYCPNPVGRFAYVVGAGTTSPSSSGGTPGTLSPYSIDSTTGALTLVSGSTVATGPRVSWFQPVPNSHFAWALNIADRTSYDTAYESSGIYVYTVDPTTGLLSPASGNPFQQLDGSGNSPNCGSGLGGAGETQYVALYPSGTFGFASNNGEIGASNASLWHFTVDPTTGAPQPLTANPVACGPSQFIFDASGRFAYVGTNGIASYSVDPTTGGLTQLSGSPINANAQNLYTDPAGRFVYATAGGNLIQTLDIDFTTGKLTPIGSSPLVTNYFYGMAIEPRGRFAYATTADGIAVYTIDPSTGALSPAAGVATVAVTIPNIVVPTALQIDPSGRFAYMTVEVGNGHTGVNAYTIDATTGALTLVSGSPFAVAANPGNPSVITVTN
jgi:6-phosphogluconolactonase (cycloisomerase 2 family)